MHVHFPLPYRHYVRPIVYSFGILPSCIHTFSHLPRTKESHKEGRSSKAINLATRSDRLLQVIHEEVWNDTQRSLQIEREPRTVIHVKRAKLFDHMGWFEVPSISRKWIASRFGVGLSPQNHPLKSAQNRGKKVAFIYVKRAKAKNNVISYLGVPRVRNDQRKQF